MRGGGGGFQSTGTLYYFTSSVHVLGILYGVTRLLWSTNPLWEQVFKPVPAPHEASVGLLEPVAHGFETQ